MSTIYVRDCPILNANYLNGDHDYMVVVKPHPGGAVNRMEIAEKADAVAYAEELSANLGFPVVDQTE